MATPPRPTFIISSSDLEEEDGCYPGSDERHSFRRAIGEAAGLERIGVHVERLPPGRRTSWPHAERDEEEFVFVLEGQVDAWIDGHLHRMKKGDLAAFPAGTGIAHTFLNDGDEDALLLVGGERSKPNHRIAYPLHDKARVQLKDEQWWDDAPRHPLGPHDGMPRKKSR